VIADILLEKALSIMTTDHWVWEFQILDDGLKLSLVLLGDLATEDNGDLLGWPMVRFASSSLWPS
jgi:hypothetical protein